MRTIDVAIHALAFGGDGVGRTPGGKAIFVPGTVPGERVRARIVRDKGSHAFALLDEILERAPERIEPRCSVAGICGGCTWQHIEIAAQRAWKRRLLAGELARLGLDPDAVLEPIRGGESYGFRIRARLHRRGVAFGTLERRSIRAVPLRECPILEPDLERFALDLSKRLESLPPCDADVELYADAEGRRGFFQASGEGGLIDWENIAGPLAKELVERSGDRRILFEPGVFVQTNRGMNALLVEEVLRAAGSGDRFAEVYAGAGNLTLNLVDRFARGTAAEADPAAVRWLWTNTAHARDRLDIRCETDDSTARSLAAAKPVDLLVADPPRAGMRALYPIFEKAPPARVVMASCHPMAAVRDIAQLVRAHRYRLISIVPIDVFPQTDHLEIVARLDR